MLKIHVCPIIYPDSEENRWMDTFPKGVRIICKAVILKI